MKNVIVPVSEILSIVSCAESYGFDDDVLLSTLAEWLEKIITEDDLEQYSRELSKKDGYGEEDYHACLDTLTEWYNTYLK